eukprot:848720-Prorocentrum_minimum.AAC.4
MLTLNQHGRKYRHHRSPKPYGKLFSKPRGLATPGLTTLAEISQQFAVIDSEMPVPHLGKTTRVRPGHLRALRRFAAGGNGDRPPGRCRQPERCEPDGGRHNSLHFYRNGGRCVMGSTNTKRATLKNNKAR